MRFSHWKKIFKNISLTEKLASGIHKESLLPKTMRTQFFKWTSFEQILQKRCRGDQCICEKAPNIISHQGNTIKTRMSKIKKINNTKCWWRWGASGTPTLLVGELIYIYRYIFLGGDGVFVAAQGLSLVAVNRSYSSLWCAGFSLQWLLLLWSMGSRRAGFSSCGTWAQ